MKFPTLYFQPFPYSKHFSTYILLLFWQTFPPPFVAGSNVQSLQYMHLCDYNFTSATCDKSASNLTLPNTTDFLLPVRLSYHWTNKEFQGLSNNILFPFVYFSTASGGREIKRVRPARRFYADKVRIGHCATGIYSVFKKKRYGNSTGCRAS
jgi:hypothetical protein